MLCGGASANLASGFARLSRIKTEGDSAMDRDENINLSDEKKVREGEEKMRPTTCEAGDIT